MKLLTALLLISQAYLHAAPPDLSKVTSPADLDAVIAATADAPLKQALTDHERLTQRHAGLDFKLTGVEHAHVVKEVLA